jgi:putative ABC transport system substrate-binding protein
MNRRDMLALGGTLLASPALALAQAKAEPRWRVGLLGSGPARPSGECVRSDRSEFRAELKKLGYEENLHYVMVSRCSAGDAKRLPDLGRELVVAKVDVIVAYLAEQIAAAKAATDDIPIVMVYAPDPVAHGWARNLARPGGNLTGMTWEIQADASIGLKVLEILKEAVPGVRRIAVLGYAKRHTRLAYERVYKEASARLGVDIALVDIASAEGIEDGFRQAREAKSQALLVSTDLCRRIRRRSWRWSPGRVFLAWSGETKGLSRRFRIRCSISEQIPWINLVARQVSWTRSSRARSRETSRSSGP